jgi:hypothetical protein
MNIIELNNRLTRRHFLKKGGLGLGAAALASISADVSQAGTPGLRYEGLPGFPHHLAKAKRVVFLCMAGGPSHLETFDYKPKLNEMHGKPMPPSYTDGQPIAQLQGQELKVQAHMKPFRACGKTGTMVSDYLPWHQRMTDDICIIKSMVTEQINHDPAHTFMNTGTIIPGRPSMGSWINYGLGCESENLPGFVVMTSVGGRNPQPIASRQWSSGFLPGRFQGVEFNSAGDPVNYVRPPAGVSASQQRRLVDTVHKLNHIRNEAVSNPDIDARVAAFELAFRMQSSVPELMDISDEPQSILDMYGATPGDGTFASNCLLARRLLERGTRFVHLYHRGWDHHGGLDKFMNICCDLTDKPTWALLTDLKQRGLLEDTLVIWGGEFGRTPMAQSKGGVGRDHHIKGFSMWMAGAGVKGGMTYGNTDDLGYHAVDNPVHVRDLHATMLHLLGIQHDAFSVPFQGLDVKLTGVEHARVVKDILA